jgi:hypothetical protein
MTAKPDPFDLLRSDLERAAERLDRPRHGTGRRHRTWRPVVVGATAMALAIAIVISTDLGSGPPDVIAEARAALEPRGDVLHLVLLGGPVTPAGRPAGELLSDSGGRTFRRLTRRTEQWSATSPLRFRSRREVVDPKTGERGSTNYGLISDGTGAGTAWSDQSWDRNPARTSTLENIAPYGDVAEVGALRTADPAGEIRRQLDAGTFTDQGTAKVDGTTLRRLVATIPGRARGNGYVPDQRIVYLIDAETYAPRRFELQQRAPAGADVPDRYKRFVPAERFEIGTYEHLPLDDATRALFAVPTAR